MRPEWCTDEFAIVNTYEMNQLNSILLILFSVAILTAGFLMFKFQTISGSGNVPVVSITKQASVTFSCFFSYRHVRYGKYMPIPSYGYPRVKYPPDWYGVYTIT